MKVHQTLIPALLATGLVDAYDVLVTHVETRGTAVGATRQLVHISGSCALYDTEYASASVADLMADDRDWCGCGRWLQSFPKTRFLHPACGSALLWSLDRNTDRHGSIYEAGHLRFQLTTAPVADDLLDEPIRDLVETVKTRRLAALAEVTATEDTNLEYVDGAAHWLAIAFSSATAGMHQCLDDWSWLQDLRAQIKADPRNVDAVLAWRNRRPSADAAALAREVIDALGRYQMWVTVPDGTPPYRHQDKADPHPAWAFATDFDPDHGARVVRAPAVLSLSEQNTLPLAAGDLDRTSVLQAMDASTDPERVHAMANGLFAANA